MTHDTDKQPPEWMKDPMLCNCCQTHVESYETGQCYTCKRIVCNSCTYERNGLYYCEKCWSERNDQ